MTKAIVWFMCGCLFLISCAGPNTSQSANPFAGDWQGSGSDSKGNDFTFGAKVIDLGDDHYRVLVLDKLNSQKKPMHIMDGTLKNNEYPYTADEGVYTGGGTLDGDTFKGWYKGPVDGTYTMQRVK